MTAPVAIAIHSTGTKGACTSMLSYRLRALPAAAILAISVISPYSASAMAESSRVEGGAPGAGWFNTGPEEHNQIFENSNVRITWGPVYVKPSDSGGEPSRVYYVIRYENHSGPAEELDCEGYAQPDTVRQLIAPTKDDLGEPYYATDTVCSETGGQWSTTLDPGETLEQGAWFDEVPSNGSIVSLELVDEYGYPGASEYQDPYWQPYDGPPRETPSDP
ncbi:hypothetical protein ABT116_01980 [Streptomyces sp. NPDC002130]|uniref:hypothetical protein n=1 Tax=Streptomyces sp. NPDC002130 TaxID=3155568 RepID=UPI0033259A31